MRRLMLLRHAKTESQATSGRDIDRALDPRGVSDAEQMGDWLKSLADQPDRVLVSPAVRARQTWQRIAPFLTVPPTTREVDSLYNATAEALMSAIRDHGDGASCLLVVAHNPGLHELAIVLSGSRSNRAARRALDDNLPTSALVTIDFETATTWGEAGFQQGRLVAFASPKTLRNEAT